MTCIKIPNGILCVGGPTVKLGKYRFEMHSYHGPIKLKKNGDPARTYFGSDFWPLLERWQKLGSNVDTDGNGIIED